MVGGGRSSRWGVWVGASFVVVVALLALDGRLKLQEDSTIYITLAQSLSSGQGYRDLFLVDRPAHAQYPPVFPLLLAPVVQLRGFDVVAMKLLMIAMAIGVVVLAGALYRELSDGRTAALVALLTATSPAIVYYAQSVMTELAYLLLSLLAIVWIERCARRSDWTPGGVAVAAILLSLVSLTRIIGIALTLAAVLYVLVDGASRPAARARTAVALAVLTAMPLSLWFIYSWSAAAAAAGIPYVRDYFSSLGDIADAPSRIDGLLVLLGKVRTSLYSYGAHTGRIIVYWLPSSTLGNLVALLLTATCAAGFVHRLARKRTVIEYYVVLYVATLLIFPGSRQQRYVVPLIPFLWFYLLTALGPLLRRALSGQLERGHAARWAARGFLISLLALNGLTSVVVNVAHGGRGYNEPAVPDPFRDTLSWVRAQTPAGSVFMWAKPGLGYVLADRRAVNIPRGGADAVLRALRGHRVDYVVIHPTWKWARSLNRVVERFPEGFRLVHQNGDVRVYQLSKPAS